MALVKASHDVHAASREVHALPSRLSDAAPDTDIGTLSFTVLFERDIVKASYVFNLEEF